MFVGTFHRVTLLITRSVGEDLFVIRGKIYFLFSFIYLFLYLFVMRGKIYFLFLFSFIYLFLYLFVMRGKIYFLFLFSFIYLFLYLFVMRGTMRGKILQHWHLNYPVKLSKPQVSFRGISQLVNTKKR